MPDELILLVDDEANIVELAKLVLEKKDSARQPSATVNPRSTAWTGTIRRGWCWT